MQVELSPLQRLRFRTTCLEVPVQKGRQMRLVYPFRELVSRGGRHHYKILRAPTQHGYVHVECPDGTRGYLHVRDSVFIEAALRKWCQGRSLQELIGKYLEIEVNHDMKPRFYARVTSG